MVDQRRRVLRSDLRHTGQRYPYLFPTHTWSRAFTVDTATRLEPTGHAHGDRWASTHDTWHPLLEGIPNKEGGVLLPIAPGPVRYRAQLCFRDDEGARLTAVASFAHYT